ncbi:hypothetical protein JCM8097_005831 [Rhodosporidiobolus ruineniae]
MFSLAILSVLALGWLCGCLRVRRRTEVDPASVALPDSPPPSPEPEEPDFTLPADIVLLILDLFAAFEPEEQANRTLTACCLVSRRMCRLAQPYLHRELRIELEPTGRYTTNCPSAIFTTQPASIERVRLVCAIPALISRLSAITIVGSMEFHGYRTRSFCTPGAPSKRGSTAFIEGFADLAVGLDLAHLYHVDYPIILSLSNLAFLSIRIPYSALEPAPRLPIPPPLLPLLSLTVTDCGQPHIVRSLISLFPPLRTLTLGFPHYPPHSRIFNGLSLELLPHLRELKLLCHSALRGWQAGPFVHLLDAVLSSSLPHPPLLAHPSSYSTFSASILLPPGVHNLAAVLEAFEFSGLPQRIKTDPRLARVEDVRFEAGEAAVQ